MIKVSLLLLFSLAPLHAEEKVEHINIYLGNQAINSSSFFDNVQNVALGSWKNLQQHAHKAYCESSTRYKGILGASMLLYLAHLCYRIKNIDLFFKSEEAWCYWLDTHPNETPQALLTAIFEKHAHQGNLDCASEVLKEFLEALDREKMMLCWHHKYFRFLRPLGITRLLFMHYELYQQTQRLLKNLETIRRLMLSTISQGYIQKAYNPHTQ